MEVGALGLGLGKDEVKFEVLDAEPERLRFRLSNCDTSVPNGLRRTIMDDVPTMAFDVIEIHENTSVVNDDLLGHRIELLPLASESVNQFIESGNCGCDRKGCEKCSVTFTLNVSNPDEPFRNVYSVDFQKVKPPTSKPSLPAHATGGSLEEGKSKQEESDIDLTRGDILIVTLGQGQSVSLTAKAMRGTGVQNAKWIPTQTCAFKPDCDISLNQTQLSNEDKKQLCLCCPQKIFTIDENHTKSSNQQKSQHSIVLPSSQPVPQTGPLPPAALSSSASSAPGSFAAPVPGSFAASAPGSFAASVPLVPLLPSIPKSNGPTAAIPNIASAALSTGGGMDNLVVRLQNIEDCIDCSRCVMWGVDYLVKKRKTLLALNAQKTPEAKSFAQKKEKDIKEKELTKEKTKEGTEANNNPVQVRPKKDSFIFVIETQGQLSPWSVLDRAIVCLQKRITGCQDSLAPLRLSTSIK
jgi:DNA-directed RNA polymerase alpha subunit